MKVIVPGELSERFFEFVEDNRNADYTRLLLSGKKDILTPEELNFAIVQIRGRKSLKGKIDPLLQNPKYLIPDLLVGEQSTNHLVAAYNASLAKGEMSLADLTAGLGIDSMAFAKNVKQVTSVEKDSFRAEILRYNLRLFGISNVEVINDDSEEFLNRSTSDFDIIYIDPSRRSSSGGRVFLLKDCVPDVEAIYPLLRKRCRRLLIKASPLLDLHDTVRSLPGIKTFHIVEFKHECKEILIEINWDEDKRAYPLIKCVNILENGAFNIFEINKDKIFTPKTADIQSILPNSFIYEPSPSVLKSGFPDSVMNLSETLRKLDSDTHLYISEIEIPAFPGRSFKIEKVLDKKTLKSLKNEHLNVISRNHPLRADQIFKKYSILPGADRYIIAGRAAGKPLMMLATMIETRFSRGLMK